MIRSRGHRVHHIRAYTNVKCIFVSISGVVFNTCPVNYKLQQLLVCATQPLGKEKQCLV